MPRANILRETTIVESPRVLQLRGMFDIPASKTSRVDWDIDFDLPEEWNIGAIVGASGSGKTTILNQFWGKPKQYRWDKNKSLVDCFPEHMSIKEITQLLSSVGFSSPPSWLRPYIVLSNGEQFRASMARLLAESKNVALVDEYTSVVDRNVAKIGSHAIQKTVRKLDKRLIVASCHFDILDWLGPDWVFNLDSNQYYHGRYLQRPGIELEIFRCSVDAWRIFRAHHYLNTEINRSANCFMALYNNHPVAFTSWVHLVHNRKRAKREHRTVCLPDYQGAGIGNFLVNYIASCVKALGFAAISTTSHPAMIRSRAAGDQWAMRSKAKLSPKAVGILKGKKAHATTRLTARFEYIGPPMDKAKAIELWGARIL